ncbi:MAG: hypothetical protein EBY38_07335, partial [Flavobacteriaceae bacterium]|nr:hypothetical protein [Flavobacteriaceae bacterium]
MGRALCYQVRSRAGRKPNMEKDCRMLDQIKDIDGDMLMDCPLCKETLPSGMIDVDSDCGWCWDCIDSGKLENHLKRLDAL